MFFILYFSLFSKKSSRLKSSGLSVARVTAFFPKKTKYSLLIIKYFSLVNKIFLFSRKKSISILLVKLTTQLYTIESSFLTSFRGSPFLVLLGVGLTLLVIDFKNTRTRKNWAAATNSKKHNSPTRLPSTTTNNHFKPWKIQLFTPENFETLNLEIFAETSFLLNFETSIRNLLSKDPFFA